MDLRFLSNFLKVADFQNLTAASAVLNLAPTALSRQIRLLERKRSSAALCIACA
ncbi:LysR family transcriptional regulator [Bradyrhizobium sp. 62B]|uniref:LysR family transcriptional regulator n=1 Tax=Bradyrhizobium sp. 62B TaxID=2898442 RepID=UPI0035E1589D